MKVLFGRLLFIVAMKLGVPVALVYYVLIGVGTAYLVVFENFTVEMLTHWIILVMLALFYIVFPAIWSLTTGGLFWRVPTKEQYRSQFGLDQ